MSSSGLIYAFIVGAWAVYLVPMWLRREDELNQARQTRRYTTAIKVLSHKESFERRYGRAEDRLEDQRQQAAGAGREQAEVRLPVAVGQGAAPEAGHDTLERVRAKEREQARTVGGGAGAQAARGAKSGGNSGREPGRKPAERAVPATAARTRRPAVHASVGLEAPGGAAKPASAPAPVPATPATSASSPMLRARRRRVVGVLFAVTSLGAIVSMDLGLRFVWAMLLPAAALSAYIVWVRKDERARAAERARRHAAAARAAREARETRRREQEELEREQQEREAIGREEQARREAAARRRAAAARARTERRVSSATASASATGTAPSAAAATTPARPAADPRDLPRAANG